MLQDKDKIAFLDDLIKARRVERDELKMDFEISLREMENRIAVLEAERKAIAGPRRVDPRLPEAEPASDVEVKGDVNSWKALKAAVDKAGNLPLQIEQVIEYNGGPMKVARITEELAELGVTTGSTQGLGPMVASALNRNCEGPNARFVKVARAIYTTPALAANNGKPINKTDS